MGKTMNITKLSAKHKGDPVRMFIIYLISIYLTIIALLLYVTHSAHPFGFLFNIKDYSGNHYSISQNDFKSTSNDIRPIGLFAEYIIKNNPGFLKRSTGNFSSDNDQNTIIEINKKYHENSYNNYDTDINSNYSASEAAIDLTKYQDNNRTSKQTVINSGFILSNKKTISQYIDTPGYKYNSPAPTLYKTPYKQQSNNKVIPATNTQSVKPTAVVGNYTNELPFNPLVKYVPQKPKCPDLITPQMKTRFNFSILSQWGCNPTFSYN